MKDLIQHIVIVDNNSSIRGEKERLINFLNEIQGESEPIKVKIIFNDKNTGYASGNNIGLRYLSTLPSKDNLVAIMNPDIKVTERQLKGFLNNYKYAEKLFGKNSIGMMSPWVINKGEKGMPAWKMPNFLSDIISSSIILKKIIGDILSYKDLKKYSGIKVVDVLPGSFLLLNKKAISEIGYLEEATFLYCEERILASRMKRYGYISLLDTDHYYEHEHSKTINKFLNGIKKINYLYDSKKVYYIMEKGSYIQGNIISCLRYISIMEYVLIRGLKNLIRKSI